MTYCMNYLLNGDNVPSVCKTCNRDETRHSTSCGNIEDFSGFIKSDTECSKHIKIDPDNSPLIYGTGESAKHYIKKDHGDFVDTEVIENKKLENKQ